MGIEWGSLADWGFGIAGLIAGGATGAHVGALRRAHLEDRRALLRDLATCRDWILSMDSERHVGAADPSVPVHVGVARSLYEAQEAVRHLPWRDRAMFERMLRALGEIGERGQSIGQWLVVQGYFDSVIPHHNFALPWKPKVGEAHVAWANLYELLRREVNPTWGSRFYNLKCVASLIVFSPRPLDKRLRGQWRVRRVGVGFDQG